MIYLDNAATSFPKPKRVYERMDQFLREEAANPGRSGHSLSVAAEAQLVQARSLLAKFFGAKSAERIIFTLNCTDSLNIAIKGALRDGDHVVTTILEHNSVLRPIHALEAAQKITVTKVRPSKDGLIDPQEIKKAFRKNTKLVAMTHASNVIGVLEPIREIGRIVREAGLLLLVDAAQTAGIVSIDVERDFIDLLAFPGHKSLYGPPGTGGLYVGERAKLIPWREGGTGFDSESKTQPDTLPFLLEGGTPNSVGIVGLKEGVSFILQEGLEKIQAHERSLVKKLRQELKQVSGLKLHGIDDVTNSVAPVSFVIDGVEPQEFSIVLDQSFQIAVRAGLHCAPLMHEFLGTAPQGSIRFSPGYFNTLDEIEQAARAVHEIKNQMVV
ncbi:MAG: cysteine desulfurase [Omnitrophica bacterium RIFCSPHIGHO2_02_FULL_46_11]|nr:MAG: cysteine desulfurase [Omnitrophica bacterium RIFCSPHIGHO2_02_FULL_46_11]OGW87828.1 MAG: cysteine desulfurase [Omnitrophica bacterium RIFCSPLOWO2_01_FULL_45_10b]